jgi:hypothetical protein
MEIYEADKDEYRRASMQIWVWQESNTVFIVSIL